MVQELDFFELETLFSAPSIFLSHFDTGFFSRSDFEISA